MSKADRPWVKWYWSDWRSDPGLRLCSYAARGLWADMLSLMQEADPYGHLLVNGRAPTPGQLAAMLGGTAGQIEKLLHELSEAGVYSETDGNVIYSRRMVRDRQKAEEDKANGAKGGNPRLKGGVNPPDIPRVGEGDKAHKPEARSQKPEENKVPPPAASPEVDLYRRGKEILGDKAGGMVRNLIKSKGGNIALARAALETASTKADPREYVGAVIRGSPDDDEVVSRDGRIRM